ncbi:MAG: hypothetical protein KF906_09280 [Actinobacteria bacterium]|nr:hypothetical protein [Actinomycetota bacterium]
MDLALAAAVAPTTMAAERTVAVAPPLASLLPEGGLVRGRTLACEGLAAPSLALSLVAEAGRAGAWLAVLDLPWLGVEAAVELGVPAERLVRVDAGRPDGSAGNDQRGELWGEVLGAVLDGFDLVVTRVPPRVPATLGRRLQTRLRTRGAVLVLIGDPGPLSPDVTVTSAEVRWEGVGGGHGHLRSRRVGVEAAGRRVPRPRRAELWLPAVGGAVAAAVPEPTVLHPRSTADPVLDTVG